ncbi:prepilin-type N-terminal cleavage/methylation domain-containing protein [bacterium]|nr:prepilin-type N-terminal cleavage/methylation domain-containing protein [bacterium]
MHLGRCPCRTSRRAGFTLIEIMVSVGLTSIMLWGLLQLFTSATRFSSVVVNETELCAAGRAVLERMVREISSAAPPAIAYLHIDDDSTGNFDAIRFVAPVGNRGREMVHVKYHAVGTGGRRQLMRATEEDHALGSAPSAPEYNDAAFGVEIEGLTIRYISATGAITSGNYSAAGLNDVLPRAVLLEVHLREVNGLARITLSTGVILPAGGI